MAIRFACGFCAKGYKVDESLAGKRFKCKECGEGVKIPASGAVVTPAAPAFAGDRDSSAPAPPREKGGRSVQPLGKGPGLVIEPHKKLVLGATIFTALTALWGLQLAVHEPDSTWVICHAIPVSGFTLGLVLMGAFGVALSRLIWTYTTPKRVVLNHEGVKLPNGRRIAWSEVDRVTVFRLNFVPMAVRLKVRTGRTAEVPAFSLGCGVARFAQLVVFFRDHPERRAELRVTPASMLNAA